MSNPRKPPGWHGAAVTADDRFARALRGELNTPLGEAMRCGSNEAARSAARRMTLELAIPTPGGRR